MHGYDSRNMVITTYMIHRIINDAVDEIQNDEKAMEVLESTIKNVYLKEKNQ